MLVLSRKAQQRIIIGGDVELVVVAVNGDRVKLGFNAPSNVPINREEVHRRILAESGHADANWSDTTTDDARHAVLDVFPTVLDS